MEKKKTKLWKIILLILVIVLLAISIITIRKVLILSDLDKKVTDYENNNNNIYIKTTFNFNDYNSQMERFIKDDVDKVILEKTDSSGIKSKIIQITYPNERKFYTEFKDNKILHIYSEKAPTRGAHIEGSATVTYSSIMNFTYSISLPERILNSLVTKIKTTEVDGIKCYELSSLCSSNYIYDENATKLLVYINKDTGLPIKAIEKIKESGTLKENITTYEYKFNVVTDDDLKEPDNSEYTLSKNS